MIALSDRQFGNIGNWLLNEDTGLSSLALCAAALGAEVNDKMGRDYPRDPSDFRRCVDFLIIFSPITRNLILRRVAKSSPQWDGLVKVWEQLWDLYEEESAQDNVLKLYDAMRAAYGKVIE